MTATSPASCIRAFWLVKQRNRRVHGGLHGDALERQVASDIARTHDSRAAR